MFSSNNTKYSINNSYNNTTIFKVYFLILGINIIYLSFYLFFNQKSFIFYHIYNHYHYRYYTKYILIPACLFLLFSIKFFQIHRITYIKYTVFSFYMLLLFFNYGGYYYESSGPLHFENIYFELGISHLLILISLIPNLIIKLVLKKTYIIVMGSYILIFPSLTYLFNKYYNRGDERLSQNIMITVYCLPIYLYYEYSFYVLNNTDEKSTIIAYTNIYTLYNIYQIFKK